MQGARISDWPESQNARARAVRVDPAERRAVREKVFELESLVTMETAM